MGSILHLVQRNENTLLRMTFPSASSQKKSKTISSNRRPTWPISTIPLLSPDKSDPFRQRENNIPFPIFLQIFKGSNRAANLRQKRPPIEHIVRNLRQTVISPRLPSFFFLFLSLSSSFRLFLAAKDTFARGAIRYHGGEIRRKRLLGQSSDIKSIRTLISQENEEISRLIRQGGRRLLQKP